MRSGANQQRWSLPRSARPRAAAVARFVRDVPAGQRGTSLIELMIGLAVLSIVMSVALPGLSSLVGRFYTRSAAEDLLYATDLARSRARAQRIAFSVSVGTLGVDGEGLHIQARRGATTACASANATNGALVYESDWSSNNARNNPTVVVLARAPAELSTGGMFLCFKPDGRLVRSDTELTFAPPTAGMLAGDVFFTLARVQGTTPIGDRLQLQVAYNGSARITFGHDLTKLQGVGP